MTDSETHSTIELTSPGRAFISERMVVTIDRYPSEVEAHVNQEGDVS
jgi:hypothetical protein